MTISPKNYRRAFSFSKTGIVIGLVCFATLWLIDVFGPRSYSSSGAGVLMADGTFEVTQSSQSILPMIARTAFYAFVLPLVLGAIAVFRKERIGPALGSFCLGLAPIPIYTLGVFMSAALCFALALPAIAVVAARRIADKHRDDQLDPR